MSKPICAVCQHCKYDLSGLLPKDDGDFPWYVYRCGAHLSPIEQDPVSGRMGGGQPDYCRDHNKGQCDLWQQRLTLWQRLTG